MSPHVATVVATWFGAGLLPKAPGTWASVAALPPGLTLIWAGGPWLLALGVVLISAAGVWASGAYATRVELDDPSQIVVDEVAGQWLALLPMAVVSWQAVAVAFVLFRIADIFKPWPASWADRELDGGLGVMADDWIAGIFAGLGLWLLQSGGVV